MQEWNPSRSRNQQSSRPDLAPQAEMPEEPEADKPGRLAWWYRLTSPKEPAAQAGRAEREKARRARLASTLLLFITLIWVAAIPVFFLTVPNDPATLPITIVGLLFIGLLLFLNRQGWVSAVVWILVGLLYLSVIAIFRHNGSLQISSVGVFDILIYAELLVVSLLPAYFVFLVMLSNCTLILLTLFTLAPPNAFNDPGFVTNLTVGPLVLQVFVAVVTFLWVRSTEREMARADQAELIAIVKRQVEEERSQVEADSRHLLEVLTRVASGDTEARVNLRQDSALWQLGMVLNTFLSRTHNAEHLSRVVQRTKVEADAVAQALREAKAGRPPRLPQTSGSLLDPIIAELTSPRPRKAPSHPTPKPPWESEGGSGSPPPRKPAME